ncbi:hypothetical protein OH77DRAFT_1009565 [Trametes cingulata]|nr:hypothetical protein OH77DRAFT_832698 [Trametes cingulata]KAI0359190.1 hypothetical protein OH77DRAFT_1009565 [Trametes cingulata]
MLRRDIVVLCCIRREWSRCWTIPAQPPLPHQQRRHAVCLLLGASAPRLKAALPAPATAQACVYGRHEDGYFLSPGESATLAAAVIVYTDKDFHADGSLPPTYPWSTVRVRTCTGRAQTWLLTQTCSPSVQATFLSIASCQDATGTRWDTRSPHVCPSSLSSVAVPRMALGRIGGKVEKRMAGSDTPGRAQRGTGEQQRTPPPPRYMGRHIRTPPMSEMTRRSAPLTCRSADQGRDSGSA